MTDQDQTENTEVVTEPTELELLTQRAAKMGISHHPSIGVDKLKEKINEKIASIAADNAAELAEQNKANEQGNAPVEVSEVAPETPGQERHRLKKELTKLVRVRVACMNPDKREYEGEFFSVGNAVVPQQRRYVHFGVEWHIPLIMLNMLQEKESQVFVTVRDERGNKSRKGKMIKQYSIEILPDLTGEELHDLAQRQAMANGQ